MSPVPFLLGTGAVLECWAVLALFFGAWSGGPLVPIAAHVTAVFLSARALTVIDKPLAPWKSIVLDLALALPLPGIGWLGIVGLHRFRNRNRSRGLTARWLEEIEYVKHDLTRFEKVADPEGFVQARLQVEPVQEIMTGTDPHRKVRAIAALERARTPDAVRVLKIALSDPHPEVNFHASAALARLEESFTLEILAAERDAAEHPEDADAHSRLGNILFEYTYLRLPDAAMHAHYLNRAVAEFEVVVRLRPEYTDTLLNLARGRLGLNDTGAALAALDRLLAARPDSVQGRMWRAETRFLSGDYEGVRADCAALRQAEVRDPAIRGVVDLWTA